MSDLIEPLQSKGFGSVPLADKPEIERIRSRMDAGNELRLNTRLDVLALAACQLIKEGRPSPSEPTDRTAYVLRSLKNPAEVLALRNVYGSGFFLISLFAAEEQRLEYLTGQKGFPKRKAQDLIDRDASESDENGQQTRDTFHLADAFASTKEDLFRILDLLFGSPFVTPAPEEHAMFLAYAASARSADLSRQVGAVITTPEPDLEFLAAGCNDVPAPGGGLYWPGEDDARDHVRGHDSNMVMRNKLIVDLTQRYLPQEEQEGLTEAELLKVGLEKTKGSRIQDLTEYGRAVHAEMEALLSCARKGINCRGGYLFTTTYPCHNCARHIVAAGISRVIYVEPYPKSLAVELHDDSLKLGMGTASSPSKSKTVLIPFIGVGPRRYLDLFSLNLSTGYQLQRKKPDGSKVQWRPDSATLRTSLRSIPYLEIEQAAADEIAKEERRLNGEAQDQQH